MDIKYDDAILDVDITGKLWDAYYTRCFKNGKVIERPTSLSVLGSTALQTMAAYGDPRKDDDKVKINGFISSLILSPISQPGVDSATLPSGFTVFW